MTLDLITPEQAANDFAACLGDDPEGQATPQSAAHAGVCFKLETDQGRLTYAIGIEGGVCWIHGAAGTGKTMTETGLAVIEAQAAAVGCKAVGFQTLRRGLVRKARALGYKIKAEIGRGFVLEKNMT